MRKLLFLLLLYRWGIWGIRKWRNLLKFTQLVSSRAVTQTQAVCSRNCVLNCHSMLLRKCSTYTTKPTHGCISPCCRLWMINVKHFTKSWYEITPWKTSQSNVIFMVFLQIKYVINLRDIQMKRKRSICTL